jgi:hypothetical protein
VKITNNLGVMDVDTFTAKPDDEDAPSTISTPNATTACNSSVLPIDAVTTHCDVPTWSHTPTDIHLQKQLDSFGDYLDVETKSPLVTSIFEPEPLIVLPKSCGMDDVSLFGGFITNEDDDCSSLVAVDELLSIDSILEFDMNDNNMDYDWL